MLELNATIIKHIAINQQFERLMINSNKHPCPMMPIAQIIFSEYLLENKDLKVSIHGHTDNIGTNSDNLVLSKSRALTVYNFLIREGVDIGRLSYDGFGEEIPLSSNSSKEGRAENRRTEFVIVGSKEQRL